MQDTDLRLVYGWGERLCRAFVCYLEETEVANREVQHGPYRQGCYDHG